MIKKQDASIIGNTMNLDKQFCAYEHLAVVEPGKPPEVVFVSACKLLDVYRMVEGRRNSEWAKMFRDGGDIMVRIIATGPDRTEIIRFAMNHMRQMSPRPRCNLHGVLMKGVARPLICSNGQTFNSQVEAARALGVSASAISRHLKGELNTVAGYTFGYEVK